MGVLFLCLTAVSLHAETVGSLTQNHLSHKTWAQMSSVERIQFVCAMSGVLSLFVAEIWFIVAGFKASVGWGLFMLFIGGMRSIGAAVLMIAWMIQWVMLAHQREPLQLPLMILGGFVIFAGSGAIIFIVRHWQLARKPLAVLGLGGLLLLAAVGLDLAK